jgi:hypothetical protein
MKRRRRRSTTSAWLWLIGLVAGAAVAYLFLRPTRNSGTIPVPGQAMRRTVTPPQEEIRDSDRQALDRVLRERSRPR